MSERRTTSSTGGEKGVKDERTDLVPPYPVLVVSRLYGAGARKYADHNWRRGYEWSKSIGALERHLLAFKDGQDLDEHEPGCAPDCTTHTEQPHMAAVVFHAFALIQFAKDHAEFDDRYKPPARDPRCPGRDQCAALEGICSLGCWFQVGS